VSRQKAIDDHCKSCVYDPLNGGTWRKQVELCPCTDCSLYEYRPLTEETRKSRANGTKASNLAKPLRERRVGIQKQS